MTKGSCSNKERDRAQLYGRNRRTYTKLCGPHVGELGDVWEPLGETGYMAWPELDHCAPAVTTQHGCPAADGFTPKASGAFISPLTEKEC